MAVSIHHRYPGEGDTFLNENAITGSLPGNIALGPLLSVWLDTGTLSSVMGMVLRFGSLILRFGT